LVLQIVQNSKALLAERYTYLPYFGLLLILIVSFENKTKDNLRHFVYLIFALFFSFNTFNYIKTWKNTISLWGNTFRFHPENKEVAISYINLQNKENDPVAAYKSCKKSIESGLKEPQVFLTMAQIEIKSQEYNEALKHLTMAQNNLPDSTISQSINLNKSAVFGWIGNADSSGYYLKRFQEGFQKKK
jgi:protein O-mannosyl-transferase